MSANSSRWDGAVGIDRPLALVGPTASGKTAVTLALANLVGPLEAVAADSMTVYRHMNIGTATATAEEQARVPHHLVDLVDPADEFSVARFQRAASSCPCRNSIAPRSTPRVGCAASSSSCSARSRSFMPSSCGCE